jgi:radical SAM protein with 4Fe4S-binding SPASM domain
MESPEYLKLKSSIYAKDLKNGEFLLLDTETGIWIKTSFSFKYFYKLLKKGLTKNELEEKVRYFYSGREDEVNICLDSLRSNGFLEGFQTNLLIPLDKIKPIYILCDFLGDKNLLIDFLKMSFKNIPIELILNLEIQNVNIKNLNLSIQNGDQIKPILRIGWDIVKSEIIDGLSNAGINNIQINFKGFGKDENDESKKIELIEKIIKEGRKVELRYAIANFLRKERQRDFISPLLTIPYSHYYFTAEEIFEFTKERDRYKYFVYWVNTMTKFYVSFSSGSKLLIKFYSGNFLPMVVFSRILRDGCGAGNTNFYISPNGYVYPCKYLKDTPLGTIDKPIALPSIEYSKKYFHLCEKCYFQKICCGLCKSLQSKGFSKICNFYKKYLIDYISAIPLKAVKELYYSQEKHEEEKSNASPLTEEAINRFKRRVLCPIGIF